MKLDSVRSLKQEISAEVVSQAGDTPEARSFFESTEPPMPEGVALGVALKDGEHLLAVRTDDPAKAEAMSARAGGEVDVRIIKIAKRMTPGYLQGTRRPLEPGLQIGMKDKNFVGTLGCFVRDGAGVLYALTNSHVAADEGAASPGHVLGQPFGTAPIGVLARFVPFSRTAPNLVDAAIVRLDSTKALPDYHGALPGTHLFDVHVGPQHLGSEVIKAGRTTGARVGQITATELDGVQVAYDLGILRFNDQIEVSGKSGPDFSAGGDSGSLVLLRDGGAIGLLFAGGRDGSGEDFTYCNPLTAVLLALGVELA